MHCLWGPKLLFAHIVHHKSCVIAKGITNHSPPLISNAALWEPAQKKKKTHKKLALSVYPTPVSKQRVA